MSDDDEKKPVLNAPPMPVPPTYLGDSLYADYQNGLLRIWASNGVQGTIPLLMEPETVGNLFSFATRCFATGGVSVNGTSH